MHCWWECKLVQSLWKTLWKFLKIKNKLACYPKYHPWGIFPKKTKTVAWKDKCSPIAVAALFTTTKVMEATTFLIDEWIKM